MVEQDSATPKVSPVPVCGIGASAGGLEALRNFFDALPADLGLAYVVILHLAPDRKSDLPAIISRWTRMPVIQVGDHESAKLDANRVYVIAPDRKLEITDTSVGASRFEQARGQRAAIDLFFRSLAASHGDGFAIVLSGSGSDGALGARAVKESGGLVLVQDPNEALHDDMPRAVIATGVADIVLPVRELVVRLAELVRGKESIVSVVRAAEEAWSDEEQERALRGIFDLLRKTTDHDFSKYKRNTVLRRLARRMQLCHQATFIDYLQYLRTHVAEVQQLFDDLLISVTTFFRDPESWEALQSLVVGPLIEYTDPDEQIRTWVPGCSTGEEAYTLAFLFHEEFERRGIQRDVIIFASDVDESALAVAREGRYPSTISADVSEFRLERYFHSEGDNYRVVGAIRDRVVFATHNLLRDPPFSRQHLISCRNLLIYLDRELQEQAMAVFRYACRDQAYLFLGASEVADEGLFRAIDKKHRIFITRDRTEGVRPPLPEVLMAPGDPAVRLGREVRSTSRETATEIHIAALEELAPPSLVVDERWNVLHLSASVSRFLQQIGGPVAHRVTDLVRPELRDELHALLHRAFEKVDSQFSSFVSVAFNGALRRVALLAQQRPPKEGMGRQVLVTFLDGGEAASSPPTTEQEPTNELVRSLREKLRETEQRIESIRDDYYLTNEELRSANEELQSLNEEYRSTTEELETSKEELQSINEELQTINHQLKLKLEEVSQANSDLENLMAATDVATLFLDLNCRISRFTPRLTELFNVKARDRERPIGDLTHNLEYDELEQDAHRVLASGSPMEREVRSRDGRVFLTRLSPYRKLGGEINGVVITFIAMTEIKRAEMALRESERKLEAELNVMRVLHRTTTTVMTSAASMRSALEEILSTAITLIGADYGDVQLLDSDSQKLKILAERGFEQPFLQAFESTGAADGSACARALRTRQTVCIEDVALDAEFAPYREIATQAGFRAVQSEPLIGKGGEVIGVLSIHYRERRAFSERDRRLGSLVARSAADLIVNRTQQENVVRLNEELRRRTAELEDIQEQLSRQAADLQEKDRNKEGFLAALGHELRNPMAAIAHSLELITATDESSKAAIAVLKRQTRQMARLVNDLLDVVRINRGTLEIQREVINLNRCVLMAVDPVRPRAEAKGLALEVELPERPLYVNADLERLSQILDNLLGNAVNYTEHGGVTISVRSDGVHARVVIRDTGIGIDPGAIAALFDPFHETVEGRRMGGLGLGLSLVKRLIEMHQGTIEIRSEGRGLGSEVTFTVPLSRSDLSTVSSLSDALPAPQRILVIEDQPDTAEAFGRLLERMGQQVRIAHNGAAGLEIARELRPQVAFVDLAMEGMSGTEVAQQLRREFPSTELTLVALSGYPRDHPAFQDNQFDYHLLKPATVESIVALLNSLQERRGR